MIDGGAAAFLQQAHRNNWQQYLSSLRPGARHGWDLCVLTAGDERQASMYRRQLDWRREAGLLPARTQFLVLPDPDGRRIGSGGATLRALLQVQSSRLKDVPLIRACLQPSTFNLQPYPHHPLRRRFQAAPSLFCDRQAVCPGAARAAGRAGVHDLRRVPHQLERVGGGIAARRVDRGRRCPVGLRSSPAPRRVPAEWRHRRGRGGPCRAGHPPQRLCQRRRGRSCGARLSPQAHARRAGSGVGHFIRRHGTNRHRSGLAGRADGREADRGCRGVVGGSLRRFKVQGSKVLTFDLQPSSFQPVALNLYGDLLLPLAASTTFDSYLSDVSDGPATPEVQAARRIIWQRLRGTPFAVERLQPAAFAHFGTSQEYWRMVAGDPDLARLCGWSLPGGVEAGPVLINAVIDFPPTSSPTQAETAPALVIDSHLAGPCSDAGCGDHRQRRDLAAAGAGA